MIVYVAKKITNVCIRHEAIKEKNREIVEYGIREIVFSSINFIAIALIALVFNVWWLAVVYCCVYVPFRVVAGGYHANSRSRCFLITLILFISFVCIYKILDFLKFFNSYTTFLTLLLMLIVMTVIVVLSPVQHTNNTLTKTQCKTRKKKVFLLTSILFLVNIIIACFLKEWKYGFAMTIILVEIMIMIIAGRLFNENN